MIDPQFAETFAHGPGIAKQADLQAGDALLDPFDSHVVPKRGQPPGEYLSLADLEHVNFNAQLRPNCQL